MIFRSFLAQPQISNGKFVYYRVIKTFCNWACKYGYISENPIEQVEKPKTKKILLPSITEAQIQIMLKECESLREKTLLGLLYDSGLRLSELTNIRGEDINFEHYTVTVLGKGGKERKAPFTEATARLLKTQIAKNGHNNIWGLKYSGIATILRRLEDKTGIRCNPHSFRRGFACRLHRKGLSTLDIQRLGGWESLQMVQRYTASISFEDCPIHYREKLG